MRFIFDTGAEHTILFKRIYADLLGVPYGRKIKILGSDLSREVSAFVSRNMTLGFPNGIVTRRDIIVLEEDYFHLDQFTGVSIDGIIGANVFRNLVVKIDYKRRVLHIYHPEKFSPPAGNYHSIDMKVVRNRPFVQAFVKLSDTMDIPVNLLVDSGASINVLLHNNTHADLQIPSTHITGNLGAGIGGLIKGYLARIEHLTIEHFEFDNLIVSFQALDSLTLVNREYAEHGLMGNQLLHRFMVILDYWNKKLYLKPIRKYNRQFKQDRSGLFLFAAGANLNEYVVQHVIQYSPAYHADVLAGDVIKLINGIPAGFFSLSGVLRIFQGKEGRKVRLTVERNGIRLKKQFQLRDLI